MKNWTSSLLVLAVICAASASTKGAGNLSNATARHLPSIPMQEKLRRVHNNRIMAQNLTLSVTTEASRAVLRHEGTVALGGFRNTGLGQHKDDRPKRRCNLVSRLQGIKTV